MFSLFIIMLLFSPANTSSSASAFRVPAVANMMVVSRSPRIPDTVLAAFSRAWVPRARALRVERTLEHFSPTLRALSETSLNTKLSRVLAETSKCFACAVIVLKTVPVPRHV